EGRRHADRGADDRRDREPHHDRDFEPAAFDRGGFARADFDRADFDVARDGEARWEGSGDRYASMRADEHGRELRVGERIASVRKDERGTEYRVEDRWTALRREDPHDGDSYGESDWEATFRSMSSKPSAMPALPAARGESPERFLEERP